jgi:hypothetical protein
MHKNDVVRFERHSLGWFFRQIFTLLTTKRNWIFWAFFESVNSEIMLKYWEKIAKLWTPQN